MSPTDSPRSLVLLLLLFVLSVCGIYKLSQRIEDHRSRDLVVDATIVSKQSEHRYGCDRMGRYCGMRSYDYYSVEPPVVRRFQTNRPYSVGDSIRVAYSSVDSRNFVAGNQNQVYFSIAGWVVWTLASMAAFAFLLRWLYFGAVRE